MKKQSENRLPILEVDDNMIISRSGECTMAFELSKPALFSLDAEEIESIRQVWLKAMRLLPYGTILHWQDWYTEASYEPSKDSWERSFLQEASDRHFEGRPYLHHRGYLFITKSNRSRKPNGPGMSSLISDCNIPEGIKDDDSIREFKEQVWQFMQVLDDGLKVFMRVLRADELTGNREKVGVIEQYIQLSPAGASKKKGWKPELLDVSFKLGVTIGNQQCLMYTMADTLFMPRQCSSHTTYHPFSTEQSNFPIGFATPLGPLLNCNHIYNQYIFLEDPKSTVQKLELKGRRLHSLSAHSRENAQTKLEMDEFLQEGVAEKKSIVRAHFNVITWSNDYDEREKNKRNISSAISAMGALPHLETVSAPQIWWAGIPGNAADMPVSDLFYTYPEQATCFLIPESNSRSSESYTTMRMGDRVSGKPLDIDITHKPMSRGEIGNRNKFVLGGTGSGKSFFTNHLMRHHYEQGHHIVIVDIGNSYSGLCELVGGYYFTYSEENPIRFNPFWLPPGEFPDTEKRESLKTLLAALWKKEDESYLRSEYVAISNAIQGYYEKLAQHPDIFPCFNSFYEFLRDEFTLTLAGDRVKLKDFDMDSLLYVLRPYYIGGEFDYLLNATEQLDLLEQRFVVFELDKVKDHPILFPVITIVIMEVFISKMRKLPGEPKTILIEEAWKAIARQGMSEYIRYLFKTVRKFYGEAIVVTQEIEDLISSPIIKQAIINSSDCKILLDLSKFRNRFKDLQELLGLTEKDKMMVLSLNRANEPGKKYKEVFISLGTMYSAVYRTEVSKEEYLVYTTEAPEKLKVQEYAKEYGSYQEGVSALAGTLVPAKAS